MVLIYMNWLIILENYYSKNLEQEKMELNKEQYIILEVINQTLRVIYQLYIIRINYMLIIIYREEHYRFIHLKILISLKILI